jgi:predicted house-cleaning noncanonical NTP pyrophosphatase (MazG superfamily)
MRYIEVPGEINEHNQLLLDESLEVIKPQKVKIDIIFLDDEEYHEETKEEILEGIREGFHDCLIGNTFPISELWDDIMIETTGEINDRGKLILDRPLRPTKHQNVDVVIWFIKDRKSAEEIPEGVDREDRETSARELSISEK